MATMTTRGLEQVARLVAGATTSTAFFDYVGIGCGDVTESSAHTALHQEITSYGGRKAATNYYSGSGGYFGKWQASWGFSGSTSVKETGLFVNLASSATMAFRHKFAATKSMSSGDSLSLTLSIQFS